MKRLLITFVAGGHFFLGDKPVNVNEASKPDDQIRRPGTTVQFSISISHPVMESLSTAASQARPKPNVAY